MGGQTRGERSQAAILDAAAHLIRTKGVQATSISDISAESGASTGAIYHHFGSKQGIIEALAARTLAWPMSTLASAHGELTPTDVFEMAIMTITSVPEIGSLVLQLGAGAINDDGVGHALFGQFEKFAAILEHALATWAERTGVAKDDLAGIIQLLSGLIAGFNVQRLFNPNFDAAGYRSRCTRLLASLEDGAKEIR